MPITTDVRAIYLGTHRDLDPDETRVGAERAGELLGSTFGSAENPLARSIFTSTLHDGNSDGTIAFDGPRGNPAGENAIAGGETRYLDTGILYRGTVTYMDGTTATNVPLRVLQDTQGNLVLMPPPRGASSSEIAALTSKPLQSITLTRIEQNNFTGLNSSRYGLEDAPEFICFRKGTLILTERGEVAVEDLRPGDGVLTRDHGHQPLRWIGSKPLSAEVLHLFEKLRPVRIGAGALGAGLPARDLYVSQQHRILVDSKIAERMFGDSEVLIAAKHLTGVEGIAIDDSAAETEYFHLLFDRHEIIHAEGAQTESLFTGAEALKAVDPAARAEIMALFPELLSDGRAHPPARRLGSGREGRQLARRHAAQGRELQKSLPC